MFPKARKVLVWTLCGAVCAAEVCGQTLRESAAGTLGTSWRQREVAALDKKKQPGPEASKELYREQAVQLLREVLNYSRTLEEPRQKSALVSDASLLLWKYDEQFARDSFSEAIEDFLQRYREADAKSSNEKTLVRGRLDGAMSLLLKALARKDAAMSESAMRRYQEAKLDAQKNTSADPAYRERLSLAQESLDSDLKQSVALASKVLEVGVPADFTQYLYDLRKRDAAAADALYGKALGVLSRGRAYGAADAINLSAYAFREPLVLIPVPDLDAESKRLVFGMYTRSLSTPEPRVDASLPREYMASAYAYLTAQLQPQSPRSSNALYLGQSLFLVKKLGVYASRLGAGQNDGWQQLEALTEARCRNLNLGEDALRYLKGFAERLAAQDDVFQMGDASSLQEAKETEDVAQRVKLLVRGVWNLIQAQKFQDAEQWIKEVEDDGVRSRLANVLHYYAGKRALEAQDWNEFDRRTALIEDLRIRSLLLLSGAQARAQRGAGGRAQADQYLLEARTCNAKVAEKKERARILVALASLSTAVDAQLSRDSLAEAVKAINATEDYDEAELQLEVTLLPDFRVLLTLPDSNLGTCFKRSAELDWLSALILAEGLNSKKLQAAARIAVCRAVL